MGGDGEAVRAKADAPSQPRETSELGEAGGVGMPQGVLQRDGLVQKG